MLKKQLAVIALLLAAYLPLTASSCDGPRVVTLTGQSGLAAVNAVDEVRKLTNGLVEQKVMTPEQGVMVLERLKVVVDTLQPLPGLLRLIDVNNPDLSNVEKALVILENASQNMSVVIAGVPLSGTAQKLVDLIRAAQKTITTTLIEVAAVKGGA